MTSPGPSSTDTTVSQDLPADRETALDRAGPQRRAIFDMVRKVLDDLEAVAPWGYLYSPPDEHQTLVRMENSMIDLVEGMPQRVEELLASLSSGAGKLSEQTLEDIDFFFGGIHGMVTPDLERLKGKLQEIAAAGESDSEERAFLCEITADIKGKYSSAVMGAAASLIAEGIWNGVEVEPLLFPEKAEEFRRNEQLVEALQDLIESIERLPQELSFTELAERWRSKERRDRYVLADLEALKSKLGMLLRAANRRALYSGDFHQIQRREQLLSERLSELETLHRSTWTENSAAVGERCYERLVQLVHEVAAVIDVNILQGLVGVSRCKDLRAVVVAERATASSKMGTSLPANLRPLVPLMAEDDLLTFCGMLQGSVSKRLSLRMAEEERVSEETLAPDIEPPPVSLELVPGEAEVLVTEAATSAGAQLERKAEPAPVLDRSQQAEAVRDLNDRLKRLRSTRNPSWKGFLMTERLLSKHGRIPPRMFGLALPFIEELITDVIPQLESMATFSELPLDVVEMLGSACRYLKDAEVSPRELRREIPKALETVSKVLAQLEAKTTELVVLRSVF